MNTSILETIQAKAQSLWEKKGILDENINISARTLSVEEAIGNPEGDDFPLQRGKEKLMEAVFRNARGQAFTDRFGDFSSPLRAIVAMKLDNNFRRAIFVSAFNAVQRSFNQAPNTIHCRDEGPALCAPQCAKYILDTYGKVRIAMIGYQPKMIEALAENFELRVVDLDPDNIGNTKCGLTIEGPAATENAINAADLLFVTGSTLVNDTLGDFLLEKKPTLFFGTTVAAAAELMGWPRFCCESS